MLHASPVNSDGGDELAQNVLAILNQYELYLKLGQQ